jgi:hypothetical protein
MLWISDKWETILFFQYQFSHFLRNVAQVLDNKLIENTDTRVSVAKYAQNY